MSLAWPGTALPGWGCSEVLTALGTHCCCGDRSGDPLDDLFFLFPFPSFFLSCSSPGRYKPSIHVSLSLIFHKEGFCPLLCTGLDVHHPELKEWKERGAKTLLSP